jgi:hypothetical protein
MRDCANCGTIMTADAAGDVLRVVASATRID